MVLEGTIPDVKTEACTDLRKNTVILSIRNIVPSENLFQLQKSCHQLF